VSAVRVNEVRALTYSQEQAREWWAWFRLRMPESRFTTVSVGFPGDLVDVACDSAADAEWLAARMVEVGIPKAALTVIP
jgi:hypothetical protein